MAEHRIVLVGGGHTHVQVLQAFAKAPEAGARLTLVSDRVLTPYSGMLPGHLAGQYPREAMHIDLQHLADRCGAVLVRKAAVGIDRPRRDLLLADGSRLAYDTLSLNIGITPDLSGIAGADHFALSVKPISGLLGKLDEAFAAMGTRAAPRRLLVVGGGPAGVEIALALRARLDRTGPHETAPWIGLAAGSGLVPTLNARARGKVRAALARRQIEVFAPCRIAQVGPQGAQDDSGRWIASDLTIVSTAARGPSWLAATDLPLAPDGSVLVGPTLASLGDDTIFAAGDCAEVAGERREKAGVFAVRQGPPLALNLRRRVRREPGADYRAQRAFLTILSTGDRSAIAARGRWFAMEGRWVWWWKDRIDRAFVSRFNAK